MPQKFASRSAAVTFLAVAVMTAAIALPLTTLAKTTGHKSLRHAPVHRPAITHVQKKAPPKMNKPLGGVIAVIDGTNLTMTGMNGKSYAIDASQAALAAGPANLTLPASDLAVGDKIMVTGTLNGTALAAKIIRDMSALGRNVFAGTVSGVSDNIVSLNLNGNKYTNYAVDAGSAIITKGANKPVAATVADIGVGDKIEVLGALNGERITATQIVDMTRTRGKK